MEHQLFHPHFNTQVRRRQTRLSLHVFLICHQSLVLSSVVVTHQWGKCGCGCVNAATEVGTVARQLVSFYLSQTYVLLELISVLIQQKPRPASPLPPPRGWTRLCWDPHFSHWLLGITMPKRGAALAPTSPHGDRSACFPVTAEVLFMPLFSLQLCQGCLSGLTICSFLSSV